MMLPFLVSFEEPTFSGKAGGNTGLDTQLSRVLVCNLRKTESSRSISDEPNERNVPKEPV